MTLRRILAAALLALVGLAGCHRRPPTASAPPPPPAMQPSSRPEAGADSRTESPPSASREPAQPLALGRPISSEVGMASWYGPPYANRKGADGNIYDGKSMTAAHRTLPMGSVVRVTNLSNGRSVFVKITDRGPFVHGRILDLSIAAAKALDVYRAGIARVRVEAYGPPSGPEADPAGRWCVQIGAFSDPADAVQLKNDLARRYRTARVIEFAGPTGHWVRINPAHPDRSTAQEISDSIHLPDPDAQPYLVRLN